MALPPISPDLLPRTISLTGLTGSATLRSLKDIHEVFNWLRSLASSAKEREALDAEEAEFMRAYGKGLLFPKDGITVKSLLAWVLYGDNPFGVSVKDSPIARSQAALKSILEKYIKQKFEALDRIVYLLRILNQDKVEMSGHPKPPVPAAVRDVKSYHAGYNDRTAYRLKTETPR